MSVQFEHQPSLWLAASGGVDDSWSPLHTGTNRRRPFPRGIWEDTSKTLLDWVPLPLPGWN